jgi:hypothetical protein
MFACRRLLGAEPVRSGEATSFPIQITSPGHKVNFVNSTMNPLLGIDLDGLGRKIAGPGQRLLLGGAFEKDPRAICES